MSSRSAKKKMPKRACLILVCALAASAVAAAPSFVPRKSPEFKITEPSGKSTLLSSLRGKLVVMEFFFIQSGHCMRIAGMLNKLNTEMGARGLQALGVVFDPPNAPESHGLLVGPAVDYFKLTYPVGYASKADVDSYLARKQQEILNIPQIIVIDRAGMIRAASGGAGGDPRLEDDSSLRSLIDSLLNEHGGPTTAKK
jgi:peroxiredoxin